MTTKWPKEFNINDEAIGKFFKVSPAPTSESAEKHCLSESQTTAIMKKVQELYRKKTESSFDAKA